MCFFPARHAHPRAKSAVRRKLVAPLIILASWKTFLSLGAIISQWERHLITGTLSPTSLNFNQWKSVSITKWPTYKWCVSVSRACIPSVIFHCACVCSVKIPPPRLCSLTARSGHVLVKWSNLYRVSSYLYNCQVRHQKVCACHLISGWDATSFYLSSEKRMANA